MIVGSASDPILYVKCSIFYYVETHYSHMYFLHTILSPLSKFILTYDQVPETQILFGRAVTLSLLNPHVKHVISSPSREYTILALST